MYKYSNGLISPTDFKQPAGVHLKEGSRREKKADEKATLQIQENPYLQYFCGYPGYDDSRLSFDPSLMVHFRKRLTLEVPGESNDCCFYTANPVIRPRKNHVFVQLTLIID